MDKKQRNSHATAKPPNNGLAIGAWIAILCLSILFGGCATPLQLDRGEQGLVDLLDPDLSDDPLQPSATLNAHAESTDLDAARPLKIDEVLQYALDHHPLLRARQHEVEIARAGLTTAGLLPNPQLVMDTESPVHEGDATDLTTRLTFTIPIGGKLRLGKSVAHAGIRRAQFALGRETEAVLVEAADAAVEVLYYQEMLALRRQLSELAAKEAQNQKARFDAMAATFADKIEADFDAADIELQRLQTIGKLDVARLRLARAMGLGCSVLPQMAGAHVVVPIPDVPLQTILAAARATRPELAEARAAVTQSQREIALAHANARPDPEMGPRYQAVLGEAKDTVGARFNVDLPLFDRNQGGISQSLARLQVSHAILDVSELATLSDVASAYLELLSVRARLRYYDTHVIPLVDRTEASILNDPQQQQAIGANQISDLLQQFVKMRVSHLELRYQYNKLLIRLELFLGCRLDDLQQQPNSAAAETLSPGNGTTPG